MSQPVAIAPARRSAGFTLIEVMIAVAIVAILAAIAIPAFTDAMRKSRRSDAFTSLSAVQQAQERWRGNNASYAANSQLTLAPAADPPGLGQSATTPSGYYDVSLGGISATGYTATAIAVSGKSQASDAGCQVMAARMADGNLKFGSGASVATLDWADPQRCWAR